MVRISKTEVVTKTRLLNQGLKKCGKCRRTLPKESFQSDSGRKWGLRYCCRKCGNEMMREYYHTHQDQHKDRKKTLREKRKVLVISHYSPEMKCQNPNCLVLGGCKELKCLSIDHIKGAGAKHRRQLQRRHIDFYVWIIRHNYPKGLQVLCMNCQWIKRANNGEYKKGNHYRKVYKENRGKVGKRY